MYSACVKIWHGFLHSVAIAICFLLAVAIVASLLGTPLEIAERFGSRSAHRVIAFFEGAK